MNAGCVTSTDQYLPLDIKMYLTLPLSRSAAQRCNAPHLNANLLFKNPPFIRNGGGMNLLGITDVERIKPELSFSCSSEGRLINPQAGQVSWQRMATGGGHCSQI